MSPDSTHVAPHVPITVAWSGGTEFDASRDGAPGVHIDSDAIRGPSPVDLLLASVATCAATDVVTILEKQRTPPSSLHVRVESTRVTSTPRRLASVVLHFVISGKGIVHEKAARAVALSVDKYCSVRSSLASDISVTWTVDIR
jgi:putative redox protein